MLRLRNIMNACKPLILGTHPGCRKNMTAILGSIPLPNSGAGIGENPEQRLSLQLGHPPWYWITLAGDRGNSEVRAMDSILHGNRSPGGPPAFDPAQGEERLELGWRHPHGLFNLSWVNFLLRIVTLGIYHFWAKTEVRKRLWSAIRINGEPLTYTGRGLELFIGFALVVALVLLPGTGIVVGLMFVFGPTSIIYNVALFVLYVAFFFLAGMGVYRAMRYRLSRTRWRGIRASLVGSSVSYAWTYFWTFLVVGLTAGWFLPWRTTRLQTIITNDMRFGDRPLKFTATSGPLYGPFAVMWFGGVILYGAVIGAFAATFGMAVARSQQAGMPYIPSAMDVAAIVGVLLVAGFLFALVSAWYQARVTNHFAKHTHFENATFRGQLTARGLIWLAITNLLILIAGAAMVLGLVALVGLPFIGFDVAELQGMNTKPAFQMMAAILPVVLLISFGLLMPIVQARSLRYMVQNLAIDGTAPLAQIMQSADQKITYGEGLAEAFDVDGF
jgi:uncharacterized membrane protein YjgN (DUF898 family)